MNYGFPLAGRQRVAAMPPFESGSSESLLSRAARMQASGVLSLDIRSRSGIHTNRYPLGLSVRLGQWYAIYFQIFL